MTFETFLLIALLFIYIFAWAKRPSWRSGVSLIIVIGLLICNSLEAYPSEESRERAKPEFVEAGKAVGCAVLESLPLVLEPTGPVGVLVGGALVSQELIQAANHARNALNTLRDQENDVMSSRGHMEWNAENNMREYEYSGSQN